MLLVSPQCHHDCDALSHLRSEPRGCNGRSAAMPRPSWRTRAVSGRRVYFSVHYDRDIWRATTIRNTGIVDAVSRAGWQDASLWEAAKKKGTKEVERLIEAGLKGTSVTVVLIGAETAGRRWVKYEIDRSVERGNGLLGIRIHGVLDQNRRRDSRGPVPSTLRSQRYQVRDWDRSTFGRLVERAAIDAGKPCLAHGKPNCILCRWWY